LRKNLARLLLGDEYVDFDEHLRMEQQNVFWSRKVEKVSNEQERLLMRFCKMREKLYEAQKVAKIGRVALDLSQVGVLVVNKDYAVINVNDRACEYLGQQQEDVIGKTIDELETESKEAREYINFFFRQSERAVKVGKALPERTFSSEDQQFSIQGFYDINDNRDFEGGYLFIFPNKTLKNTKRRTFIAPVGALTRQTLVQYAEELMGKEKSKIVDLATSSANMEALEQLYNYYKCFNNERFTFRNVSRFERDYLVNLGVDEKDIISFRQEPKPMRDTGEYPAIQGA